MTDPNDRYRPPRSDEPALPPQAPDETAVDQPPYPPTARPSFPQPFPPAGHSANPPADQAPPVDPHGYPAGSPDPSAAPYLAPAQPAQTAARPRNVGPSRLIAALLVTVLAVVVIGGVAIFASRSSTSPSAALAYLPADTATYQEMRLDLPGDQRQRVGQFLAHFPGFADPKTLDQGLDQALDNLLKTASKERYSYTGDVKPWFSGQLSLAILDVPQMTGLVGSGTPPAARILAILGVQDKAKAQVELDKILVDIKAAGASAVSSSRPDGTPVVTVGGPSGGNGVSYALTADAIVLSTRPEDLNAALDRKTAGTDNLGKGAKFGENLAKLRGDRVGMTYVSTDAIRTQLASLAPAGKPGSALVNVLLTRIPASTMASFRFEADRLVIDSINRAPTGGPAGSGKDSGLIKRVPGDSLAYVEVADVGTFAHDVLTALKQDPLLTQSGASTQQQVGQLEAFLGTKLENYLDWLGNVAVTGGLSDGQPAVAVVASVIDETVAKQRLTQLSGFLQLAGGSAVKVTTQDYAGTKLTTISSAQPLPLPGNVPSTVSFAIKDGTLFLGLGEAYTKKLLDLKPEASLGQAQRFADAVKAAGGPATSGMLWVDITSLRTILEDKLLTGEQRDKYTREYQPYIAPLDQLILVGVQDGPDQQSHFQFIVK